MTQFEEKLRKLIQNTHDCSELNCWEEHEEDIQAIKSLVLEEVVGKMEDEEGELIVKNVEN